MKKWLLILFIPVFSFAQKNEISWIRINQLGYTPGGIKVAVYCSKIDPDSLRLAIGSLRAGWELFDANSDQLVCEGSLGNDFGKYGPFKQTYRVNFSAFKEPGTYYLRVRGIRSPVFTIGKDVYKGAADFCLRYMRQQRSGFNPFLKDSCHTHDGYVLYGEKAGIKDSTHIDVTGGWHDASDYLQYSATSANATYHLLMAWRDFPKVFTDEKLANGLDGKNGMADVLDEAKWGLDWLLKMNPSANVMFNQLGDDRDHMGMRIPKLDSFYGKGYERPVYFISGEPQQRGKFMNNTRGTSSTAGKFAGVFALADYLYGKDEKFQKTPDRVGYYDKAMSAYEYANKILGVTQTASVRSPYIYAEDNWTDDMELASAMLHTMTINMRHGSYKNKYLLESYRYAKQEHTTPWLGADTANHYQWYPFINIGHYELAKQLKEKQRDTVVGYYKEGIQRVWNKAKQNAFYHGVPFIWCSNNLTTSFAIQCYWYRQLTNDKTFSEFEQANFDWLFGCNPWGTSMVYGLPSSGDTPTDPHSAFTHLKNYPVDGGLIDGPVYTSIYKNLIGITLYQPDEYADFQSELAVYHDDYGDYSTNEPTMDGTASLIYLLAAKEADASTEPSSKEGAAEKPLKNSFSYSHGGIIRGDSTKKEIALAFTGHEFAEGGDFIANTLEQQKIKASFFFTGDFYRNPSFTKIINKLKEQENYVGIHGDKHLLYCDWTRRDSLLVDKLHFERDILQNRAAQLRFRIVNKEELFIPSFEWYNDSIAAWTKGLRMRLINYTPGTLSHADYTNDADKNYRSSETIYHSITEYEKTKPAGLNGFILLIHIGAGPGRTDKFYKRLPDLIKYLKAKGYKFQTVNKLLRLN